MPLSAPIRALRSCLPALLVAPLLSGCLFPEPDKGELPEYQLSSAEQAWAAPYQLGDEWRFRNAQGYERRYQIKGLSDQRLPGMETGTARVGCYQQSLSARLERVDSAYVERPQATHFRIDFSLTAAVPQAQQPLNGQISWGTAKLTLPITALNQHQALPVDVRLLPQATLGSRQYQNVLEYTTLQTSAARVPAWQVQRVYYTKEYGVVRFVEANGAVWDRE